MPGRAPVLFAWFPRGTLPPEQWPARHRAVRAVLAAHAPGLLLLAASLHRTGPLEIALCTLVPVVGVVLAGVPAVPRTARACVASAALMGCAAVAVHLTHGQTETHFQFFALVPVIALYEQWAAFGAGVAFVVIEHAVVGSLLPTEVFGHGDTAAHPVRWALVHGAFFTATCVGCLVTWRLQELARDRERALSDVLRHRVHHDRLTGLPNRDWLLEEAAGVVVSERPSSTSLALILLDVTGFGEINDTLGHEVGDELLREVACRLVLAGGPDALPMRIGPDDFALLLCGSLARRAEQLAGTVRTALTADRIDLGGVELAVDVTMGVAVDDQQHPDRQDAQDPSDPPVAAAAADGPDTSARLRSVRERLHRLLRDADVALQAAGESPSGVLTYARELDGYSVQRLALLSDLREALFSDELQLAYQPKISLVDGAVVGVEALLRWTHPTRGPVPPLEFVPAAEATNLVVPLTHRVLSLALLQAARWADAGLPLQVSINLPPRLLVEKDFLDVVRTALAAHGVPSSRLCLELTESTLMTDAERTLDVIADLHALGVELSIDDFGTGYSSLSYLRRLPVDELKIDKAFVRGLLQHSQDSILVETTIQLAHRLGMSVVAEGVEDTGTADALAALGCDVAQGYLFSPPLAAGEVVAWTRSWTRSRPVTPTRRGVNRSTSRAD